MDRETRPDGRRERSDATRRRLLDASAPLFARVGYDGTSLDDIAAVAAVNRALVRYHFGSKQGLYSAVLSEAIAEGKRLLAPVRASADPPERRLAAFVAALGELLRRRPHFAAMIVREWMSGAMHFEPEVQAEFVQFFHTDREILEQGVASGVFRPVDTHSAHLSLVGSLVFFQISAPARERFAEPPAPAPSVRDYLEHVRELFLRGLST